MKKFTLSAFTIIFLIFYASMAQAQCTLYDTNSLFPDIENELPCGPTCGTDTIRNGFEVWSNEAYLLGELKAGSNYIIELGTSSGWNPTLTVAAWDGTTVGAVAGFVDGRRLDVTIPSDGEYILIISVTGSCNGTAANQIDNGELSIYCGTNGATCSCTADLTYELEYDCDNEVANIMVSDMGSATSYDFIVEGNTVATVSGTGATVFPGVPSDYSLAFDIMSNNNCSGEGEIAAIGCAGCENGVESITDGGFAQPGGAVWTESSIVNGAPSGLGVIGTTYPLEGSQSAWLGGWTDTSVTSISQDFMISADDTATLSFWFLAGICDSESDYFAVYVDGDSIEAIDGGGAYCGDLTWYKVEIDFSDFADGNTHTLMLEAYTFAVNGGGTNFFVDELRLDACPTTTSTVGVKELATNEIRSSIQPNPASHISTLEVDMAQESDVLVEVVNITGQVLESTLMPNTKSFVHPLNVQNLPNGTYIVRVTSGNHITVKKMIVNK